MYIAHHTKYSSKDIEGALLEKIDLQTGKAIWQKKWDLRNEDRQEWVESIFKNQAGELVVVSARRIAPPNDGFAIYGDTCLVSIRNFSTTDGSLLKHIKIDESDKESLRIRNNGIIYKTILYPISENRFQYYALSPYHDILYFYNIDENGHQLSNRFVDTLKDIDINNFDILFDRNMFKVSEDTLVMLDFYFNKKNPDKDTQTIIKIYDKELSITNHFKIDSLLNFKYKRLFLVFANHEYIFIRGNKEADSSNIGSIFYLILNYDGGVERQFTAVYNGYKHFFNLPLKLKKEGEYLFTSQNNHFYGLDFTRTTSTDSVKVLREFYYDDINYGYSPKFLWQLKNGDILSYGLTTYYDKGRYFGISPTLIRFKAEDLGLKSTSTLEFSKRILNLTVSPNPAGRSIKVMPGDIKISKIRVFNIYGKIVVENNFISDNQYTIDVSGLSKGIYIIKAYNNLGRYKIGKFIKQ